jgi:uncharacterized protein (DUF3084 family)
MKLNFAHLILAFTLGIMATSGVLIQNARAGQPHMDAALDDLRAARHELEVARHDKGGHRDNAINAVDTAISEVKAGINYAD